MTHDCAEDLIGGTVRLKLVVCARFSLHFHLTPLYRFQFITLPAQPDYCFSAKYVFIYLSLIIKR